VGDDHCTRAEKHGALNVRLRRVLTKHATATVKPRSAHPQLGLTSSPTYGASLLGSMYRVAGTVVGAIWAIVTWVAASAGGRWPDEDVSPYIIGAFAVVLMAVVSFIKGSTIHFRLGAQIAIAYNIVLMPKWANRDRTPATAARSGRAKDNG